MKQVVRGALLVVAVAAFGLILAACGSGSGSSSSGRTGTEAGSTTGQGGGSEAQTMVDTAIKSTNTEPPTNGPKIQAGKNITAIIYGLETTTGVIYKEGIEAAAKAAGWNVDVVDGEFSSNTYLDAIRKAITEHVDGIALYVIDCATVQAGAEEAKKAGIPVIYIESFDCDEGEVNGPQTGYTVGTFNLFKSGEQGDLTRYEEALGELQAAASIVANEGSMKSIVMNETDAHVTELITKGFRKVSEGCPDCSVEKEIKFVGSDFGPPLQEKVEQALLQSPEANTVFGNYDDPVIIGAAPAVRAAGRNESVYVTGAGGYPPMIELIREGGASMTAADSVDWLGWATVDRLNRIFAGETETPAMGIGLELVDGEDNLPEEGKPWEPKVDFESAYEKTWGVR